MVSIEPGFARRLFAALIGLGIPAGASARAEDGDELEALKKRVSELEARMSKPGDSPGWSGLTALGSKFKLYGFLRLDAYWDDSRPNNTQTIGWIRSEDPAALAAGIGAKDDDDTLTIHPRLTRIGLDLDGGTVEPLGDARLTGKVEIDFYNNGLLGQAESRSAIRMRHAWTQLAWGGFSLQAGQDNDVISPIFPVVNNDLVMWGAGNLGDRRPQVRFELAPAIGGGRVVVQGEVGLTGADDNVDLDTGTIGAGYRDGEASGLPTLQGRVAFRHPVFATRSNLEIGAWYHRAWEDTDTQFGPGLEDEFDSFAYGADVQIPLWTDRVWLKGEIWGGRNLDDVRGGIFQGINATTGSEIRSRGGFAELGVAAASWVTLFGGISRDNPIDSDLNAGGRKANDIWYVATRSDFGPVQLGLEYLNWTTKYRGFGEGDDHRIGCFIAYRL